MGARYALSAWVVGIVTGCGSASPASQSTAATVDLSVCRSKGSVIGGPINDVSGPYYHQAVIAQTTDGLTMTGGKQVLDHASVPDGVRRADGSVYLYYVNGVDGTVWVARTEGDTVRVLGAMSLDNVPSPSGIVDPDVTLMPDGKIRLAYFGGFGPPNSTTPRAMCIADSDDGMKFTVRAVALPFDGSELLTDPSLLQLGDGTWLMAISSGQRTLLARSADGLTFTRDQTLSYGGVPELARAPDGSTRLYVCAQGIESYRSTDGGRTWVRERVVVQSPFNGKRIVCDPSLVAGAGLFVFKTG